MTKKKDPRQATILDAEEVERAEKVGEDVPTPGDESTSLERMRARDTIDTLARLQKATEIIERRRDVLKASRNAAIALTEPSDWVLNRDRDGSVTALLRACGAQRIRPIFGIDLDNFRPLNDDGEFQPEEIDEGDGVFSFRGSCSSWCNLTQERIKTIEARRRSDEKFIGRQDSDGKLKYKSDLKLATMTSLLKKAVVAHAGLNGVSPDMLLAGWTGQAHKTIDKCRKGHGYGKATERTARKVADEGVAEKVLAMWEEILKRTGGDVGEGKTVIKEITANKEKGFNGFDDHERITQDWQLERALANLAAHPKYGDPE